VKLWHGTTQLLTRQEGPPPSQPEAVQAQGSDIYSTHENSLVLHSVVSMLAPARLNHRACLLPPWVLLPMCPATMTSQPVTGAMPSC
jgi:hypothetical protein